MTTTVKPSHMNTQQTLIALMTLLLLLMTCVSRAAELSSPYAGQQHRPIKSLSADDISALNTGQGWGLAKAAELNGYPGPLHVLELRTEINLSGEQLTAIESIYQEMLNEAVPLGKQLVADEQALNEAFAQGMIDEYKLKSLLSRIAETRSALRYVHLHKHLITHDLLTPEQVRQYNQLRGYGESDPCEQVPKGHNPVMWKKHHGCEK